MSSRSTFSPSTSAIAAVQASGRAINAHDRGSKRRELDRRKRIYVDTRARLETLLSLMEEGNPELLVRNSTIEVVLRFSEAVHDVEPILRDVLDKMLGQMEANIVALHLAIEREEQENLANPSTEVDYASTVLHLCGFTEGLPTPLAPVPTPAPMPAREQVANVRTSRTATTANGTGLGSAGFDTKATVAA